MPNPVRAGLRPYALLTACFLALAAPAGATAPAAPNPAPAAALSAALSAVPAPPLPVQLGPIAVQAGLLPPALNLSGLPEGQGAGCPMPAGRLDAVLYAHLRSQGAEVSCGNAFMRLLEFPGDPAQLGPLGGFSELASAIRGARSEVLLANMVWDAGPGGPGRALASALADLRAAVLVHPERYPQGMTVRVLLGHSVRPEDAPLDPRLNLDYAAQDLLAAGLPLTGEAQGGWRLEVADYAYAVPHSHSKLLVLDRERVVAGGYNVSTLHLPVSTPGGRGSHDLGLEVRGPVARQATSAFYDLWRFARPLRCPPELAKVTPGRTEAGPQQIRAQCTLGAGNPAILPRSGGTGPVGSALVYPLYRRSGEEGADAALTALLAASESRLDLMQAQVSGDPLCDLLLGHTRTCEARGPGLPAWQAVAAAVKERGVRVRLLLDQGQPMATQNWALLRRLRDDLARAGAQGRLQVRWAPHRLHTKAIVVDGQMAVVGSTNLHFSSFGPRGLTEYALATSDPAAVGAVQANFETEWAQGVTLAEPWWYSE